MFEGLAVKARTYILLVAAAAGGLALLLFRGTPLQPELILGFGFLCFLAEQFPVPLAYGAGYSVSFVITMAAIVALGPGPAALAAAFGGIAYTGGSKKPRFARQLFNAAQLAITTGLAGAVYVSFGGPVGETTEFFPRVLLPAALGTAVNFTVNTGLVATMVALAQGLRLRDVWTRQYLSLALGHGAFALLGVILAVLYLQMGWAAVLFLLVPLLVARNAFQASVKMQGSYESTVRSLITAIEVKDAYTRGHAERVARLSEMVARELGLSDERVRVVRFAALMHDVGKLGVSTKVLQKPGRLTPEEYEHMKAHPIRGHEIVGEIDFLAEAVSAVRHHHERMDGSGYPDGLAGDQIPLFARIIMVADAFDSMTSTRVYRQAKSFEEALAELIRCQDTQFDATCLQALHRAIDTYGWEAFPEVAGDDEDGVVIAGASAAGL